MDLRRLTGRLRTARYREPLDARGLRQATDPELRVLEQRASALARQRLPRPLRPVLRPMSMLLWTVACILRTRRAARITGWRAAPDIARHCLATGCRIDETATMRMAFPGGWRGAPPRSVINPVLRDLADPAQLRILADKVATAERLRRAGVATPPTIAVLDDARAVLDDPAFRTEPAEWFIKPVTGSHGDGAFRLARMPDGRFAIDGRQPASAHQVATVLAGMAPGRRLLVQPCLRSETVLPFAMPDAPAPVLRLTTLREPGADRGRLHDVYLTVFRPGQDVARLTQGAVRYPVDPATGRLLPGLRIARPRERHAVDPWTGRPVAGTVLPMFTEVIATAIQASDAFDGIPVIGWDAILTEDGPVILEGNVTLGWMLPNLWHLETGRTSPMTGLLAEWLRTAGQPDRPAASLAERNRRGGRK